MSAYVPIQGVCPNMGAYVTIEGNGQLVTFVRFVRFGGFVYL